MLLLKNLFFLLVPASVAVYVPLWIAREHAHAIGPEFALALGVLAVGAGVCLCSPMDSRCGPSFTASSYSTRNLTCGGCSPEYDDYRARVGRWFPRRAQR